MRFFIKTVATRSTLLAAILVLSVVTATNSLAQESLTIMSPERAFGYVIGDTIEQRLLLEDGHTRAEWVVRLPEGRVGPWLERLPIRSERDSARRHWFCLLYTSPSPRDRG